MAMLAISAAGAWLGSTAAAAAGVAAGSAVFAGMTGAQLGWVGGSIVGGLLFPPKVPDGPRLQDLSVQSSAYGQPVPILYGTARMAGNVIWATDLQEHANEEGGKGGPSYTTYSYTCSFAVSFCEGPVDGIRRIWADSKLIYDSSATNDGPQKDFTASAFVVYLGDEAQDVDPTIQAHEGDAPAYRGLCYLVFADLELAKYGNRIPNLTAEIVQNGALAVPPPLPIGYGERGMMQPGTPYFWTTLIDNDGWTGHTTVYQHDPYRKTIIDTLSMTLRDGRHITYMPSTDEFIIGKSAPAYADEEATIISAAAMAEAGFIEFSGSAFQWNGLVLYCSSSTDLFFASVNGVSNIIRHVTRSGDVLATFDGGFWAEEAIDLPEIHCVSFCGSASLSGGAQKLMIVDALADAIVEIFDAPTYSGFFSHHAYDPTRGRVVWVHSNVADHFYLLDVTSGLTGGAVQTFFPTPLPDGINAIIYHAGLDRFVGQGISTTYLIHPETWEIELEVYQGYGQTADMLAELPGVTDYVLATDDGILFRYYLYPRLTPAGIPLSEVVTDLSERVGLESAELDVTALTDIVDGFIVSRQGTARSQIEQLMMAYQFDAVESGAKVKFVKRGRQTPVVIDADDLSAHEPGSDLPAPLPLTRADEVELPHTINIRYINAEADYQTGTQYARRLTGRAEADSTADLPIVLSDAHAKAVADAALYSAWVGRTKASFATTLKHAAVEPTDIVSIDGNVIRVTSRQLQGNRIAFDGAFESGAVYLGTATGGVAQSTAQSIPVPASSARVEFLDIPLLRDADDDAGFYVAAAGYGADWPGCVIYKSTDGSTWAEVATLTTAATMGAATTALGSFAENVFDESNTVTVRLMNEGELSSASELAVLNGANAALIGDELIQFKTATLVSAGVYTLSGLLRGRRGTLTTGHAIGDRFVLLNAASLWRVPASTAEIGLARSYKAVTIGTTLASAQAKTFTNTAVGLECLSPVRFGHGSDASGNITINWARRTRISGEWRDYADAPVSEASESYEVEIWDRTGATLKRTISASTPTVSYTAAQQTTDFGSAQTFLHVKIYQISATVGRGFPLEGDVRPAYGAQRYWRLYITALVDPASNASASEIQLRATAGGADETSSGTASASTTLSSYVPANAFDNSISTFWHSNSSVPHWIAYDFGAGNEKRIAEVAYTSRTDIWGEHQSPAEMQIQCSSNGSTWTTVGHMESQTAWAAGETKVITI